MTSYNQLLPNKSVAPQDFIATKWDSVSNIWKSTRMQSGRLALSTSVPINQTVWISDKIWFLCWIWFYLKKWQYFCWHMKPGIYLWLKLFFILQQPTANLQQHYKLPLNTSVRYMSCQVVDELSTLRVKFSKNFWNYLGYISTLLQDFPKWENMFHLHLQTCFSQLNQRVIWLCN